MRCCLHTLLELTEHASEGDNVACKYCSSMMIFTAQAWEWKP
jgi:DNA-directed RNA polymerase subunit RPC12/RpoP